MRRLSTPHPRRGAAGASTALALALVLSACGGDDGGGGGGTAEGGGGSGDGTYSVYINNVEVPELVPSKVTESEGNQVLEALCTGLVTYAPEGELQMNGIAASIESEDNTTWTVTLNEGWTFHDGTPVEAQNFVDAWNYAAYSPNAASGSYFFANISGYDDLQGETDDEGNVTAEPAATEMSGLTVNSPTEFTVTLSAPFSQFPLTVGYTAFMPLPQAFFDNDNAYPDDTPICTGAFQADGPYEPNQGITVSRYDDYSGEAAQAGGVEFRVFSDENTAYNELLANNLDITDLVPTAQLGNVESDLGDRFIEQPTAAFNYIGFPTYDERFADKRVRQAFSMAIDRESITQDVLDGSREPAYDAVPPVIQGHREDACEYCQYDPERAAELLEESGFDTSQPVELIFNAGGGHEVWMQAVADNLASNLGVQASLGQPLEFADYLPLLDERGATGPFRLGWGMDYPSMQNFLEPLYSTGALPPAGSNTAFYTNEEFDRLVQEGNEAESIDASIESYQQADDVLLEDMPIAPMFFTRVNAGYSENVGDVTFDAFSNVRTAQVTVN